MVVLSCKQEGRLEFLLLVSGELESWVCGSDIFLVSVCVDLSSSWYRGLNERADDQGVKHCGWWSVQREMEMSLNDAGKSQASKVGPADQEPDRVTDIFIYHRLTLGQAKGPVGSTENNLRQACCKG